MIHYCNKIDADDLQKIYEYEMMQFDYIKRKFETEYADTLEQLGVRWTIYVSRWTDNTTKLKLLHQNHDGYNAMLCIDLFDHKNSIIEIDENIFSFFEEITCIYYFLIRRKYRIYQADELNELWTEVRQAVGMLEKQ